MEFHQNLQTHSYDCYPVGGYPGVSNKHCLLPLFFIFNDFIVMFKIRILIKDKNGCL